MAEPSSLSPLDRIDRALARIETALRQRDEAHAALEQRHAALRTRVADAVEALDQLIENERG
jgi:hypothetical protein